MSHPTTKIYTLHDLAKIALGAPELTNDHLSVLQSLLIILLQKLNCHNESVRIQGFPAKCMEKLLKETASSCHYDFQLSTVKGFQEKYEILEQLERKTEEIDIKLEEHFEQIRNCHKTNLFDVTMWDFYAASNEDLCTLYMQRNKEFCLLARNTVFNKELRSRVSNLMVERLKEFEAKIEGMQNKLKETIELANKSADMQKFIEAIVKDIENMRRSLDKNSDKFREAMLETQEMLNCKLDRVTLPALKKYLDQRYDVIKEHLKMLQKESSKCHSTKPLAMENKKTCLSCGRNKELELSKFQPLKTIDDANNKCFCSNLLKEPTILEKMDRMQRSVDKLRASSATPASSAQRFSRESAEKRNQLRLQSHGILTNYGSSSKFPKQNSNTVSAMKSSIKKQQQPIAEHQSEKSQSFGALNSKHIVTPLHGESAMNIQMISRQNSKSRSVRLSSMHSGK
ncbi:uncharacterized protein LOC135955434 [Calliphora vicina]|uniref:uncharacterized protein LOC135955434 n=1 Tax=Calliphora vicina TaxID=7373 RepID=UPI00325B016E